MTPLSVVITPDPRYGRLIWRVERLSWAPPAGSAILSGKLSGPVPLNATVRILYRPEAGTIGDGVLVAMVPVDATGSWQVSGLKADLKYDVVARREGYNDVITANVSPVAI